MSGVESARLRFDPTVFNVAGIASLEFGVVMELICIIMSSGLEGCREEFPEIDREKDMKK